jgi:hypothetical protein
MAQVASREEQEGRWVGLREELLGCWVYLGEEMAQRCVLPPKRWDTRISRKKLLRAVFQHFCQRSTRSTYTTYMIR